jgi:hypothetical protein
MRLLFVLCVAVHGQYQQSSSQQGPIQTPVQQNSQQGSMQGVGMQGGMQQGGGGMQQGGMQQGGMQQGGMQQGGMQQGGMQGQGGQCPVGFKISPDGSRCIHPQGFQCGLGSNSLLPLCSTLVCPDGFTMGQDGLCSQGSGGLGCALFGHPDQPRCICATGMTLQNGVCLLNQQPKCKLWGDSQVPSCQAQLVQASLGSCQSVIGADVPNAMTGIIRSIPLGSFATDARLPGCESACMMQKECVAITLRLDFCYLYSKDPGGAQGVYWVSGDSKVYSRCAKPADLTDIFIINMGNGEYLSEQGDKLIGAQDGGDTEKWTIKKGTTGWTIQDHQGKFLSVKPLGVVDSANNHGQTEEWLIARTPQGTVTIKGSSQQYLSMDKDGNVFANQITVGAFEQWFITNTKQFLTPSLSQQAVPQAAPGISNSLVAGAPLTVPSSTTGYVFPNQISQFTNTFSGLVGSDLGSAKPAQPVESIYVKSDLVAPVLAPFAYSSFFDLSVPQVSASNQQMLYPSASQSQFPSGKSGFNNFPLSNNNFPLSNNIPLSNNLPSLYSSRSLSLPQASTPLLPPSSLPQSNIWSPITYPLSSNTIYPPVPTSLPPLYDSSIYPKPWDYSWYPNGFPINSLNNWDFSLSFPPNYFPASSDISPFFSSWSSPFYLDSNFQFNNPFWQPLNTWKRRPVNSPLFQSSVVY